MSGAKHRRKGDRVEREIVLLHTLLGIKAERYPLSGASRFRGSGHDVDVYAFGTDQARLVAEVKSRKNGAGFTTIESWLGEYDALFLRRNHAEPLVVLPWRVWTRLLPRKKELTMSDFDNTNRGALFRNEKRRDDNDPLYRGSINVNGVEFYLNAWVKSSKAGRTYMSLSVKPKPEDTPSRKSAAPRTDFDDDVPF
jgi:Holliday junction resolvase